MDRLDGVDVSGWDDGIDLASLTADFVIVKATEGVQGTVYNPRYREMADSVLSSGKLLGFYHYANGGDAVAEAECFYKAVKDYRGKALLALDWEGQGNKIFGGDGNAAWCKRFLDHVRDSFGGTPVLYTSKSVCNERDWSGVARDYPLWGAEYAYDDHVYQGYETSPWQSEASWGAWGARPLIHQYGYVNPKPNNGGKNKLDGEVFYGSRDDWKRMCGVTSGGGKVKRVRINDEAAEIHYFMVVDPRFGYNQQPTRWGESGGETVTFTSSSGRKYNVRAGDYDCSSSTITAWKLALQGTPYEGKLYGATYTGDMRDVFVRSGLFTASLTPAKRGDLYLAEGKHVAMCQDGGSDGVFGYDCLSEFNRNENHAASWGESGDQDGYESVLSGYYDDGWDTVLHYNGRADFDMEDNVKPKQNAGNPKNNAGLKYQAHVEGVGWCDVVRDGQTAGTVGYGKRLEAIRFTEIPSGWDIYAKEHVQNVGWVDYGKVKAGMIIGTTGKGRAIECLIIDAKAPNGDKRKLYFRVHQGNWGWKGITPQGYASGTDGMGIRLEAVKIWVA